MDEYKVLIVEDSPTMRQLIAFSLKRLKGVKIVEASDGVDGLKKLSQDSFSLIITDINMPVMDGLKLVSLIRKDAVYKEVPIFIITTEGGQEDKERAMALGANAYITKPISSPQVMDMVKSYLNIK
ncbi:MAG: response regulator [Deltaproteobacteria bacterium]|nr:response regulator [Deltaproteobacteria bacterium]MCL5276860.1 response regulator [Deltaproteobacteria bacterium]